MAKSETKSEARKSAKAESTDDITDGEKASIVEKGIKGRGNPFEPSKLMANLIITWG